MRAKRAMLFQYVISADFSHLLNLFCPFENFVNPFYCVIIYSDLLYEHSFKGLTSFLKGKKGRAKCKILNVARFARNVVVRLFE